MDKFKPYNRSVVGSCKDCEDRYPACHDTCEKYQKAKEESEERKQRILKAKRENQVFTEYKVTKIARERKQGKTAGRRV